MKTFVVALAAIACASVASAQTSLRVMTLNTRHGGRAPFSVGEQIAAIAAESPDVVLLQEAGYTQLDSYVAGLNAALHSTAWHGVAARHCRSGNPNDGCATLDAESVMVLSRFPFTETEQRLMWGPDAYYAARAVLRAAVQVDDRTLVQVFACHLPPLGNARNVRDTWVAAFNQWAGAPRASRIVGGDFNDSPSSSPVATMAQQYVDAWAVKGSGAGGTHSGDGKSYKSRIDYLFSAGMAVNAAWVPQVSISDHRPVVGDFTVASGAASTDPPPPAAPASPTSNSFAPTPNRSMTTASSASASIPAAPFPPSTPVLNSGPVIASAPASAPMSAPMSAAAPAVGSTVATSDTVAPPAPDGETVLEADDFNSDVPDVTKWPAGVVSGTEDRSVPVAQGNGVVTIGPLFANASGDHYNGPSSPVFDLSTGGYGEVQLVQGVTGDSANAMFSAASDTSDVYRIYQTGAAGAQRLAVEKKIADHKQQLASVPYDPASHQLLRIRHDYRPSVGVDDAVFETSPASALNFVELYREPWDPAIQSRRLVFELKAGTSDKEPLPGTAVWDNFRVALPAANVP